MRSKQAFYRTRKPIPYTGYVLLLELYRNCCPGGADVLDTSYRKALKLDPDCFATNLDLAELGILEQVKSVLAPDAAYLRAVLYKLNMCVQVL